ncbi:MAG: GNAT family N-acetyltransferase [Saprospiraceae bacterium]|nr:GNAT family N-acetyltransferase [Saprospiraceae bacterium]
MKPFLVVDEQISLHLARPELAEAVFGAIDESRAFLRTWLPWVDGTKSVEDTKTFMKESMSYNSDGTRLTTFIRVGDQLAGSLGVVNFNRDHQKCEIGYWLSQDFQGKGILTKSLVAFTRFLFKNKGIHRIEIQVAVGNDRSRRVPERLGFQLEGVLRQSVFMYGSYHDVAVYSLLKSD